MGVIARFLAVRSQAFEQAPEQRLVPRQACCPGGVGVRRELIAPLLSPCAFVGSSGLGHGLPPSSGLIVLPASRVVEVLPRRREGFSGDAPVAPVGLPESGA
jgi:hypothetical protein